MKRSQVAQERAKEEGISLRESEQMADSELFLDEYPSGVRELPTGWWCYMKCSSMLQGKGRKRQNACSAKATEAVYPNLIPWWTNLPWS